MTDELLYLRRRAQEERSAALASTNGKAFRVHLQLAHRYEGAIRDVVARERHDRATLLKSTESPSALTREEGSIAEPLAPVI